MIHNLLATTVLAVVAALALCAPVAPTAWTVAPRPDAVEVTR